MFDTVTATTTVDPARTTPDPGPRDRLALDDAALAGKVVVLGAGQVSHHLVAELDARGVRSTVVSRSGTTIDDAEAATVDANDVLSALALAT